MAFRAMLNATAFRSPLLRTLVPTVALAFGIQAAVAVPSIAFKTERFYDLSGSLTYLSCTALSLYLPVLRARAAASGLGQAAVGWPSLLNSVLGKGALEGGWWDWRQVVLSAAVGIWATRLGSFLFARITAEEGTDSRFEGIRESAPKFLGAFFAQAMWVSLCCLPVTAVNALPASAFPATLAASSVVGVGLWVFGMVFEATADQQKSLWMKEKKEKKHEEDFLTRGLWGKSRHPNYFGEITLWTGLAVTAGGVLASNSAQQALGWSGSPAARIAALAMCAASPAFVTFLLTKVCDLFPYGRGVWKETDGIYRSLVFH